LSLALSEALRLRVLENKVHLKLFEPKRNEARGGWRLQSEMLHDLYFSLIGIRVTNNKVKIRWEGRGFVSVVFGGEM
jgi:hypothetical protein